MLEWRPSALRSSGAAHSRYRAANTAAIDAVDQHRLRALVDQNADSTIAAFHTAGRADLLADHAWPLALRSLIALPGCPDGSGRRCADGMARVFDGVNAEAGNEILTRAISDLVALPRQQPGDDITSRLIAHPARLDDTQVLHQLVTLHGAGIEPPTNLIINTVLRLLPDPEFSAGLHAGGASVREALDALLYRDRHWRTAYPTRRTRSRSTASAARPPARRHLHGRLGQRPRPRHRPARLRQPRPPVLEHRTARPPRPLRRPPHRRGRPSPTSRTPRPRWNWPADPASDLTFCPGPSHHRALTHLPVLLPTPQQPEGVSA
ncbi:cytochrome P450 [Streptomyces pharetrae]|uniref:cytochrome P450 n=1 Tax=Streptomyces pharetrae TaxID=291370 RepID=UPI00334CDA36